MPSTTCTGRLPALIFIALVLLGVAYLLVSAALHKGLDHDENMYVASGALLARHSLWPYTNYAYFQMPYLTLVYALLSGIGGQLLLAARLFNVVCAVLSCAVLVLSAWLLPVGLPAFYRAILGVSGVVLLISNSSFVYASGLAWNHDLPVFLTLLATFLFCYAYKRGLRPVALLIAGVLVGVAVGTRISFLPALLPFVAAPLVWDRDVLLGVRIRRSVSVAGGALIALLPCALFFLASPASFLFGNLGYHQANELFRVQTGYTRAMTPTSKASYLFDVVTNDAAGWALIAAMLAVVTYAIVSRRTKIEAISEVAKSNGLAPSIFAACVALSLLAGALLPSPTWLQYFYAPVSLTVLAVVIAIATLSLGARTAYIAVGLIAAAASVSGITAYSQYASLLSIDTNVPEQVHSTGLEIRQYVEEGAGKVMTFAPLLPLEGGLDIYPELEAGPFGSRVAPYMSASDRQKFDVPGTAELSALMEREPPAAILVGYEPDLEVPLIEYAQARKYKAVNLSSGGILWLKDGP